MRQLYIILLIAFTSLKVCAQQESAFTHYMYNALAVNPAYAGSTEALSFTLLNRSQWTGMEGAPVTQTFTAHSPLRKFNSGLGLSVTNDKIGVTNNFSMYVDYSYHININKSSLLYFGLKGGFDKIKKSVRA